MQPWVYYALFSADMFEVPPTKVDKIELFRISPTKVDKNENLSDLAET